MLSVTFCTAPVSLERGWNLPHGVTDKVEVFKFSGLVIKVFVHHSMFMLFNGQLFLLARIPPFILYHYKCRCQYPKRLLTISSSYSVSKQKLHCLMLGTRRTISSRDNLLSYFDEFHRKYVVPDGWKIPLMFVLLRRLSSHPSCRVSERGKSISVSLCRSFLKRPGQGKLPFSPCYWPDGISFSRLFQTLEAR